MVDFEISNLIARVQFPLSAPGQEDKQINGPALSQKTDMCRLDDVNRPYMESEGKRIVARLLSGAYL